MTQKELEVFSRKNHKLAWSEFYPEGNGQPLKGHCLHHIDPSLKTEDPIRYAEWRHDDLVMMTCSAHMRLHSTERVWADEVRNKIASTLKGHKVSDEQIQRQSSSLKKHYENPENRQKQSQRMIEFYSDPANLAKYGSSGYKNKNKKWWHLPSGETKFAKECPGESWLLGRKPKEN